jgi:hypothetical protein
MPTPLCEGTLQRLHAMFAGSDRILAERLVQNECGSNLPFMEKCDSRELERVRFAVLKHQHWFPEAPNDGSTQ